MKRINLIINIVLAAAVIALFVLQFTGNKPEKKNDIEGNFASNPSTLTGEMRIAYINMDSIMLNWSLYSDYQDELGQKQQEMESDFAGRTQTFYQSVQDAQYKIERQLVTRAEAQQLQQQLQVEEQNLMNLQNDYTAQLQEESLVKNRKLIDALERYVKGYSMENGYHYIFSYQFGGNLLFGEQQFDISADVIKGLNETYSSDEDL